MQGPADVPLNDAAAVRVRSVIGLNSAIAMSVGRGRAEEEAEGDRAGVGDAGRPAPHSPQDCLRINTYE